MAQPLARRQPFSAPATFGAGLAAGLALGVALTLAVMGLLPDRPVTGGAGFEAPAAPAPAAPASSPLPQAPAAPARTPAPTAAPAATPAPPTAATWEGKVVGVADGDTLTVLRDGRPEKIRLHGIDCPEAKQDFGQAAHRFTADLVAGKTVTVRPTDRDKYGRTVAVVEVDGQSVNRELLAAGLAWVYTRYCTGPERAEWDALQADARAAGRGLWANPTPTPPWDYRHGGDPASPQGRATAGAAFAGNTVSRVFHARACQYFARAHCTAPFADPAAALAVGYRPCGVCRPGGR